MNCKLCTLPIEENIDKYTHIEDWICGKKQSEMWCHSSCFGKAMNRDLTSMEKQAGSLLKQAQELMNQLGIKEKEEFVI